jgi:hypothetical protein
MSNTLHASAYCATSRSVFSPSAADQYARAPHRPWVADRPLEAVVLRLERRLVPAHIWKASRMVSSSRSNRSATGGNGRPIARASPS